MTTNNSQSTFAERFARAPSVISHAPGRVNLIGEHTDYNGGFVLPMPIPQQTSVELALREDRLVRLLSADLGGALVEYQLGEERPSGEWFDYVQGLTRELLGAGHALSGFDARIHSTVPVGAGLSSSAALEVSVLRALRTAFSLTLDDVEIARIGQRCEVSFVGAPVGIMDQMASSLGQQGCALFIDTLTLETRSVSLPDALEVIVIASGVTHAHGTGEYRQRRAECELAAERLSVKLLRELSSADLGRVAALDAPLDRRARHVITENERVLEAVEALEASDIATLRTLFAASHKSMRDDFEVSVPEVDELVKLGCEEPHVVAARLTGGGFGGSVVMLCERGFGALAARNIAERYARATGLPPAVLLPMEEPDGS